MVRPANTSYTGVREDLLALVPQTALKHVLDIGCASGATGALLKSRFPGSEVTGIELDPVLAAQAQARLDRVVVADAIDALEALAGERCRFDLILCGDVLEHLLDPWKALKLIRTMTGQNVIVSLPNVAHFSTIWSLLVSRRWPYRERGLHDRTHLRFFAANNLAELFRDAGFEEVSRQTTHRIIEHPHPLNERLQPLLAALPLVRGLTSYQFLSVLRPV